MSEEAATAVAQATAPASAGAAASEEAATAVTPATIPATTGAAVTEEAATTAAAAVTVTRRRHIMNVGS